jgi:hypothetical protein
MNIILGDFEAETIKQLINQIVDYACDNEFNIPTTKPSFIVYNDGRIKKLCKKAINKINLKIEKKVELAEREYNESKAEKMAVNDDYYNNLI